jgi:hypothetical protein
VIIDVATPAVLMSDAEPGLADVVVEYSVTRSKVLNLTMGDDSVQVFTIDRGSKVDLPGRIIFSSDNVLYKLRSFREEDGFHLSKYSILLPISVLEGLTKNKKGTFVENETLIAYVVDGSPFIAALVYRNAGAGSYLRVSGEWMSLSSASEDLDGLSSIEIDPATAEDFIELYDNNYVSIEDIGEYELESPES